MEQSLSLTELNQHVRDIIQINMPETYWLRAETSDVRENQNGHCYLEFIEKKPNTHTIVARARGIIWSNVYRLIADAFLAETGQPFASGLNVLVRVSVQFHELYGYSLTVHDIEPAYTLGEIAKNRQLTLSKLEKDGLLTLNKELALPELANRIAVISSPTAAGYEDFRDQLDKNEQGFIFYTKLFPAIMQGERCEASIISALEKIFEHKQKFDAVAIIRGGGATSDLSCFDSYELAFHCTQFPLPIISGIGHERDVTVLDAIAHTRAKTPTAVAEFLIDHTSITASQLFDLQHRIIKESTTTINEEKAHLHLLSKDLIHLSRMRIESETNDITFKGGKMKHQIVNFLQSESSHLHETGRNIKHGLATFVQKERHDLSSKAQYIEMVSPQSILKRGYTLTLKNGKIIKSKTALNPQDIIETYFHDGSIQSEIK